MALCLRKPQNTRRLANCKRISLVQSSQLLSYPLFFFIQTIFVCSFRFLSNPIPTVFSAEFTGKGTSSEELFFRRLSPLFSVSKGLQEIKPFYKNTNVFLASEFCSSNPRICTNLCSGKKYLVTVKRHRHCDTRHSASQACRFVLDGQSVVLPWKCASRQRQPCGMYIAMALAARAGKHQAKPRSNPASVCALKG